MKRTNHYKREKKAILNFMVSNWELLAFTFLLVLGAVWGCNIIKNDDVEIKVLFENSFKTFLETRSSQTFFETFLHLALPSLLVMALIFLLGSTPIGIPFFFLMPVFSGLGLGFVTSNLYNLYSVKGLTYCLTNIYPSAILSVVALIFACVEGFKMSQSVLMCFTDKPLQLGLKSDVKVYAVKCVTFLGIIIFSCLVGAGLNTLFATLFVF